MRVDDIARDVGISKRTLYELFRTKQEMAEAALKRRFEQLEDELLDLAEANDDEITRLREMLAAHCRVHGDPNALLSRDVATTPVLNDLVQTSRQRSNELIEQLLHSGIARERFRHDLDVRITRQTLVVAVEGMIASGTFGDVDGSIEPAISAVFDVALDGLATVSPTTNEHGSMMAQLG